jgi:hypothetical protein
MLRSAVSAFAWDGVARSTIAVMATPTSFCVLLANIYIPSVTG